MKYNYIICHYGEIGLKGKNRDFFENKLVENIKQAMDASDYQKVKRLYGRILIELKPDVDQESVRNSLKNVFGLAYFSFTIKCSQDMEEIKEKAVEMLQTKEFENFRITTKRSNKNFPLNSQQISTEVGAAVVEKLNKKVKLKNSEVTCFVELADKDTYLSFEKVRCVGGLPVGVSDKAVVLLSGGIDSPVAAYYAMKRGVKVIFVHFHSMPFTSKESVIKTKELVGVLNKFQFQSKIYLVPFADIQKEIFSKAPDKLRVILYRRFMLRIAQSIGRKEKAKALITGDAIGQVASQTLPNINVVRQSVDLPVLSPVIGFDKEEIMDKAREIGTYDISIMPHDDCCSRFLPKHPETNAKLKEVENVEEDFDIDKLVQVAVEEAKVESID